MNWLTSAVNITPPATTGWQTVDLSAIGGGVPTNAVCIIRGNFNIGIGARKTGSSDNRFVGASSPRNYPIYCGVNASSQIDLYRTNTSLSYYILGWFTSPEASYFNTGTDKTPTGTGWQDVDCSSEIPSGSSFAIFEVNSSNTSAGINFRKKGSTDDRQCATNNAHSWNVVPLDTNRYCQIYCSNVISDDIYLVGYIIFGNTKDAGLDISTGTISSYVDVDLTLDAPANAVAVLSETRWVGASSGGSYGLRKDGDTDDFYNIINSSNYSLFNIIGLDTVNKIIEQKISSTSVDSWVLGYITQLSAPVADFSGTPTTGNEPLTVNFTDTSTNAPTSWDWDFGDGTTHGTTQNPSHEYTTHGLYTVTLTATNDAGSDEEIKIDYINVVQVSQVITTMPMFLIQVGGFYSNASATVLPAYRLSATLVNHFSGIGISFPAYQLTATLSGGNVVTVDTTLPIYTLTGKFTSPISVISTLPKYNFYGVIASQSVILVNTALPMFECNVEVVSGNTLSVAFELPSWISEGNILCGNVITVRRTLPTFSLYSVINTTLANTISANLILPGFVLTAEIEKILRDVYNTYALNTKSMALTEYINYGYNSMVQFNGKYLGAKIGINAESSGIYLLEGTHDDTETIMVGETPTIVPVEIDARLATGYLDFGVNKMVNIISGFLHMKGAGSYKITLVTDDGISVEYPFTNTLSTLVNFRKKFGKGKRGTQWKLIFENVNGEDFEIVDVLLETGVTSKRT